MAKAAATQATVTLKHLAATLAGSHEMAKKQSETILGDFVGLVVKHLKKGDRIRIGGLGILQVRKRAARMGRNPATGEPIKIKASKKVAFRAPRNSRKRSNSTVDGGSAVWVAWTPVQAAHAVLRGTRRVGIALAPTYRSHVSLRARCPRGRRLLSVHLLCDTAWAKSHRAVPSHRSRQRFAHPTGRYFRFSRRPIRSRRGITSPQKNGNSSA